MTAVKPKSKAKIIKRLHTERRRLEANLARLSREDILQHNTMGQWSFKDVLAHLAHWEAFFPDWIVASRRGEDVETPAPGLTWAIKDVHILNQRIFEEHQNQSLEDVLAYFRDTHTEFMMSVEDLTDEEVLTPGYYAFTRDGALYDWLKAYAAHDLWGKNKIRQWLKSKGDKK
jgi:hypothetical protein